ncbi:expressed unknown protein [Seminavis robusta]|uniref:Uncharacterized protein n=1 Tax=Seminavis robusta TaxID=568900 RepID=A0A9N8H4N8_9STRA|nr:expressed unknown protein [Seminavis robusta]|eukprot:Sro54_g032090.1 n/a (706) ;mRNA; f:136240-138741
MTMLAAPKTAMRPRTCRTTPFLMAPISCFILVNVWLRPSSAFVSRPPLPKLGLVRRLDGITTSLHARRKKPNTNIRPGGDSGNDVEEGEVGKGPNWIERSFPVDVGGVDSDGSSASELKKVEDYNIGISGVSFQTGSLSERMFDAIMTKSQFAANPDAEIRRAFMLYAMDFTAKEATKAALKQNGLEIALQEDEEDEGMWGDMDSIRLLDDNGVPLPGMIYQSTEDAIDQGGWQPGQAFDFVVRQVPSKVRELSLDELLQALDPEGKLREEAKANNMTLPDEEIQTLGDLANDSIRRTENAPRGATTEEQAFAGIPGKRGYRPIPIGDLLAPLSDDGTENQYTMMHVMNSFVAHGALLLDVSDGGKNLDKAQQLADMWKAIEQFYDQVDKSSTDLPPMQTAMETGSQTAKVGYASYDNDSLQFLETRRDRTSGALLPEEANAILGEAAVKALDEAFALVTGAGKVAVRIAVAASSLERSDAFLDDPAAASKAAGLMAEELLDDGTPDGSGTEFPVCMSPHRLCRYSNNVKQQATVDENENDESNLQSSSREVFGAHVDSTWVTIVPVASVSGLEVFDEEQEEWYRPELAARQHWKDLQSQRGLDPEALFDPDSSLPWHSRYVVLMPGELLQLATRNEVPAAVHRVVATQDSPSRLSAPILLRCRPGVKMDVNRYLGGAGGYPLLESVDGMTIEQIHEGLQPTYFQ